MSGVRTRRQAATDSSSASPITASSGNNTPPPKINGHHIQSEETRQSHEQQVMADPSSTPSSTVVLKENIFLFIPNIIGYSRIVLAIASLYYMPLHPRTCCLLYSISCLLDALDGYAARYFEQSTRFGAVLDMVTDRCTTSCLLVFLSSAFPRWSLVFQGLISLDFASHYMHMYATLVMGEGDSHKKVDKSRSWLLNLYYTNKTVLFITCALNETFFIALYLLSFSSPLLSPSLLQTSSDTTSASPLSLQPGNPSYPSTASLFANPWSAGALELARANKMDSTVPWIVAGISFPIMFVKNVLNVIQLVKAARWLGEGDRAKRASDGLPRGTIRKSQ